MRIVTAEAYLKEEKAKTSAEMTEAIDEVVLNIIRKVRTDKDKALYDFTEKYDGVKLDELLVTEEEKKNAKKLVDPLFFEALVRAKENIEAFHREQKEKSWFVEKENGIMLGQKITPLEKV
ncbi:MAG TPA: histidinol dehydrogenase, partial [Bacillota bacterium]|nr:histidinol dehydrogenase [Bacillota bacterium]